MKNITLSLSLMILFPLLAGAQVEKETYLYAVKGADSLYLDKYASSSQIAAAPCVIFVFGGGFVTGARDGEVYVPYFEHLVDKGYTVVSIDYRLGFKDYKPEGRVKLKEFLSMFTYTIDIAVEDLMDATAFVLDNSASWGIDRDMIIINGSSAGAITVVHAEFAMSNGLPITERLPQDFRYAGVISFAGAIFGRTRDFCFPKGMCPMLLFHGDADANVPYDRLKMLGWGFTGSKHIAATLKKADIPYNFYSYENAAHEIATLPMNSSRDEITAFLDELVVGKMPLQINVDIRDITKPKPGKKIKLMDYVRNNFGQ